MGLAKRKIAVAFLAIFLSMSVLASLPPAQATTQTVTKYLRVDGFYDLDAAGLYQWLGNQTDDLGNAYCLTTLVVAYNGKVQFGFQAFRMYIDSSYYRQYEYMSGLDVIVLFERSGNTEGYQSTSWTAPDWNFTQTDLADAIQVAFMVRFETSAGVWGDWAILNGNIPFVSFFMTEPFSIKQLISSDWNFTLYTFRQRIGSTTYAAIFFGDSTYNSRIENIQYDNGITTSTTESDASFVLGLSLGSIILGTIALPFAVFFYKRRKTQYSTEPSDSDFTATD